MAANKFDKPFFEMTLAEKKAYSAELAKGIPFSKTKPLSAKGKALWLAAKRSPGRPPKSPETKAVRVNMTFDPVLLARINACAKAKGISRAELVARLVHSGLAV
jgi:hypothetical protein